MQFKKMLFLSLLMVGLFSGLDFVSTSVNASETTNFDEIVNNPNFGTDNILNKPNSISTSNSRKAKYKIVKQKKMKKQYFLRSTGNLYSQNLKNKYLFFENNYLYYADAQETLYNKQNHKYYTYYHLNTVKGNASGWTWNKNLLPYQDMNTNNNKLIKNKFKGAQYDSKLQYISNTFILKFMHQLNHQDAFSDILYGLTETDPYQIHYDYSKQAFANSVIFKSDTGKHYKEFDNNLIYAKKLRQNKLSFDQYINKVLPSNLNIKYKDQDFSDYKIGVFSAPKSSEDYGYITIILQKIK